MLDWPFDEHFDILSALKGSEPIKKCDIDFNSVEYQKLARWFSTAPRYTTFRVNTINTNILQVIEIIKNQLIQESEDSDINNIPSVIQDTILKDCIVVGPRNINKELNSEAERGKQFFEVIVDIQCGVSVLRGANVFAPGVMGMTSAVQEGDLVSVFADLSKKCLKGYMKPYNDDRKKFLGYGVTKMTRKSLFELNSDPAGIAVEMKETVSGVPSFVCLPELGLLQNYPSILCSHILDPKEGDLILDMCASPGNKTTHIACLSNGKSCIIALDKTQKKVERIKENCEKLQLKNVTTFVCNAIKSVNNDFNIERDLMDGPPFNKKTFDRILLDAPCSALGQRPQLRQSVTVQHLNSYPNLQRRLFKSAVELLKPSGVLIYSTCTLLAAENEGIVHWALKEFPELRLVPTEPKIGSPGNSNCGLTTEQCDLLQKFGPFQSSTPLPYQCDTVGFFIAKFIKDCG